MNDFAPTEPSSLFRPEAMQAHLPPQAGEIVLMPGSTSSWTALLALAVLLSLALLIGKGSYTRRSTVTGQVHPSEGLIRLSAGQAGVVIEQRVRNGQTVSRGDVLFVLSGDRVGPDVGNYQLGIASQIEARRRSLEAELLRLAEAEPTELAQLRNRMDSLGAELDRVAQQVQQQALRVNGADDAVRRYRALFQQGFVSRDELSAKEADLAELRGRMEGLRRESLSLGRERTSTQRDSDALRSRHASQRAELQRAVLLAQQEFTEIEARRRVVITAPTDGQVTLVQSEQGQSVEPTRVLAHLVPRSARLEVRLYVPSRASGFIRNGATVLLRYDAFPYQKFGQHVGKVLSVSTAAVAPAELQGVSLRPDPSGEPVFAVTVGLPEAYVSGAGQRLPLQAGMRVEADLLHETRPLYEWILEPLFAARARINSG